MLLRSLAKLMKTGKQVTNFKFSSKDKMSNNYKSMWKF